MKRVTQQPSMRSELQIGKWVEGRKFKVGDAIVTPLAGRIESPRGNRHLEPKVIMVLECLARKQGKVVTKDELFEKVWPYTAVTDSVLTRCIYQLRRALAGCTNDQKVIQTIYKRGYRLRAQVSQETTSELTHKVLDFPGLHATSEMAARGIGFQQILSASTDHIYVFDRACRYLFANPAGASALGLSVSEMIGKHWRDLGLVAEILEPFESKVNQCFERGLSFVEQVTYPTVYGNRTFEYGLNPVHDDEGKIGCVLAIVRAITVR